MVKNPVGFFDLDYPLCPEFNDLGAGLLDSQHIFQVFNVQHPPRIIPLSNLAIPLLPVMETNRTAVTVLLRALRGMGCP
jgi:hypothetical protein